MQTTIRNVAGMFEFSKRIRKNHLTHPKRQSRLGGVKCIAHLFLYQNCLLIFINIFVCYSSSRSIKRKRFDDEIVEYSLGIPPAQISRVGRSRTTSQSFVASSPGTPQSQFVQSPVYQEPAPAVISPPPPPSPAPVVSTVAVQLPPPPPPPVAIPPPPQPSLIVAPSYNPQSPKPNMAAIEKRRSAKSHVSSRRNKRNRSHHQVSTKDLGRWKPIDDLALIIGIQQTNDLRTVHRGVKFSCKFTVPELQARWYSLLYDEPISRIAVAAMRNLHPEMVEAVQSKALYTTQEEELLGTIKSVSEIANQYL